jgi:ubiquitin carboxyl-terminal hydrolase L5
MAESRRNPKRKAADSARKGTAASIDLLKEALRPLEPKEIEEWEGWIELESEPVS